VVSTDDLIGKEAKTLLKKLSSTLSFAEKWGLTQAMCGYGMSMLKWWYHHWCPVHLCLRRSYFYQSLKAAIDVTSGKTRRIRSLSIFL
jgi:hypothetical protein